jgi:putative flippase GtrA
VKEAHRILRFLAVGLVNTGFGYASYVVFVATGSPLWFAVVGSTILAMIFNYLTYGGLVFGGMSMQAVPRFALVNTVVAVLNFAMLRVLISHGIGPILAEAILLPMLAALGYIGMRCLVFRPRGAIQS